MNNPKKKGNNYTFEIYNQNLEIYFNGFYMYLLLLIRSIFHNVRSGSNGRLTYFRSETKGAVHIFFMIYIYLELSFTLQYPL